MANRELDFSPQVTNVTATNPQDSLETVGTEVLDQLGEASAKSKALVAASQTSLAFRQLDQQYRMKSASNPNDPEAAAELQQGRSEVINQLGENVPSIAMREYQQSTIQLSKASDISNTLWSTKQMVRNASSDIQVAYKNNLQQASIDGQQFANSGAPATEIEGALHYAQLNQMMQQFAEPVIGTDRTALYLKNFQQDYTKTFVSSVAENNPQMANSLLEQDAIKQHFTPQDIDDMSQLIQRTTKQQALIKSGQVTKNDVDLTEVVNDSQATYAEKRAKIDQLDMEGSVSPKAASAARRVIKSSEDLNTQTDTPTMSGIINQAYDLNANAAVNPSDYLLGVRNIQQQVLEAQADGKLTAMDAQKVTREITNLTNAKQSSATQTAGYDFYEANQTFNQLPPEYRGQATRALFYAGAGQNWTQQQYKAHAGQVIDQINANRRQKALDTVKSLLPSNDAEFLKSVPNASQSSIAATAKKYGITEQEVIQQLRISQAAKLRAQKNSVKGGTPRADDGEQDTSNGIRLPAAPKLQDDEDDDGTTSEQ